VTGANRMANARAEAALGDDALRAAPRCRRARAHRRHQPPAAERAPEQGQALLGALPKALDLVLRNEIYIAKKGLPSGPGESIASPGGDGEEVRRSDENRWRAALAGTT
jgi:hypothetical protein